MDSSTPSDFSRQSAASISTLVDQPLSESPNKAERDKSDKMESATPVAHDHVHDHEHQHEHQSDHHEKTRRLSLGRRPVPRLFTPRSHRSQLSASAAAHHLHDGQYDEDFDIAPVDMPRELAEELSREPFQVLARHLSGVSIGSGDAIGIDSAPPDGGLEAWLVILGAWLVLFVQFGICKWPPSPFSSLSFCSIWDATRTNFPSHYHSDVIRSVRIVLRYTSTSRILQVFTFLDRIYTNLCLLLRECIQWPIL